MSKLEGIGDFVIVRKDRVHDKGGGLAFMIHKSLQYTVLEVTEDQQFEHEAIKVGNLQLVNIYIPPAIRCKGQVDATCLKKMLLGWVTSMHTIVYGTRISTMQDD